MIELNYISCNWDSIYMASGLLISMIITLFILKVSAFSEIYAIEGIAVPSFFYFGDKRAVRATIERVMRKLRNGEFGVAKENFENPSSAKSYSTVGELAKRYISAPLEAISSYRTRVSSINADMIKSYADAQILAKKSVQDLGEKIVADFASV